MQSQKAILTVYGRWTINLTDRDWGYIKWTIIISLGDEDHPENKQTRINECFNLSKQVVAGTSAQSIRLWRLTDKTRRKVLGKINNCTNQTLIDTWH